MYSEQNKKLQDSINESEAKQGSLERELDTQKEIMKNLERTKNERIEKLKRDLDNVEEKYVKIIHQNTMIGEDFRSKAVQTFHQLIQVKMILKEKMSLIKQMQSELESGRVTIKRLEKVIDDKEMEYEDQLAQIVYNRETINDQ